MATISKGLALGLVLLPSLLFAETERWVWRYNGTNSYDDAAYSAIYGTDGNIYAAGVSDWTSTGQDFTVVSLTTSGSQRWVYRYNGYQAYGDGANSIVYGAGNLYAAGRSYNNTSSSSDFTVISLTPSGTSRWVYTYNGLANDWDEANSIVYGGDGNLYAAGYSVAASGPEEDFTVLSLTSAGSRRWVYTYNGTRDDVDEAYSVIYGGDGNIYAAGVSDETSTGDDFTVVSLTSSGTQRWVYKYNGPGNGSDEAAAIIWGADGNLYAAGRSIGSGTNSDFTVISLTPSGSFRWAGRLNGPGNGYDAAYSLVWGADGNLYIAGGCQGNGTETDFVVLSLTPSGSIRWTYTYNGPGNYIDLGRSIVYGADGNLYIGGECSDTGNNGNFSVISLTLSGTERWVYTYNGSANLREWAYSVAYGSDGNIYAGGISEGSGTMRDFTVISLNRGTGIEEKEGQRSLVESQYKVIPNPFSSFATIKSHEKEAFNLYDISGRLVGTYRGDRVGADLGPGVYFLRPEGKDVKPLRIVKVR